MAKDYLEAGDNITSETHYKAANRMLEMFCANGGPYIKLGQVFGQLDQLVPAEYVEVFEPMLMAAPYSSFEDVKSIVEADTGRKLDDLFSEFDEEPIASASLA